jgi:hypothetical protein
MLKMLGGIVAVIGGVAAGIWWLLKQSFATKDEHRELKDRVASMENVVKNLPTVTHHNELLVKVIEISGNVKHTNDSVARIQRQADRTEDFLLKGGFNQ